MNFPRFRHFRSYKINLKAVIKRKFQDRLNDEVFFDLDEEGNSIII